MKQPTIRTIVANSSYVRQEDDYAWHVQGTDGSPQAGDYQLLFFYNWNGGISGVPGEEGTTSPVPGWERIFGAYGGIATGYHVFGRWWQAGLPVSNFYSVYQSPAGTEVAYAGLQMATISGVDKIRPYEIRSGDPDGNVPGVGYSELDSTDPDVFTAGITVDSAIELVILGVATPHDTGANNISHRVPGLTLMNTIRPIFPDGDPVGLPGQAMGNGLVMTIWAQLRANPGPTGDWNRQVWRYVGTEFEELAASDATRPDIDYGSVTFRIAMRGTTPTTAIMI